MSQDPAGSTPPSRPAFAAEARTHRALSAVKAAWWGANAWAGRRLLGEAPKPARPFNPRNAPPPAGSVQRAWREAFVKDAADVAAGLYPASEPLPDAPLTPLRRAIDVLADSRAVNARRQRRGGVEVRDAAPSDAYPTYYRQNFHFQSGGWFTPESAKRYEAQVEALFAGAAGPMRRRALSLLARAWRDRDQRGLTLVDLACGSGAFLNDLRACFPRASLFGLDLSRAYLDEARARSGVPTLQAACERLPFADSSLDGLTCVYLFHELPPRVRPEIATEMARVLKPGGVLAFADSLQISDEPELGRLLESFPAFFHEPFYESYQETDLVALFGEAGLTLKDQDRAFLTKALLFEKAG